jgi:hypothetical protein
VVGQQVGVDPNLRAPLVDDEPVAVVDLAVRPPVPGI